MRPPKSTAVEAQYGGHRGVKKEKEEEQEGEDRKGRRDADRGDIIALPPFPLF